MRFGIEFTKNLRDWRMAAILSPALEMSAQHTASEPPARLDAPRLQRHVEAERGALGGDAVGHVNDAALGFELMKAAGTG